MSIEAAVSAGLERMTITSLSDPRSVMEPQFNPSQFTEQLKVNYARNEIPGLSHHQMQYISTTNSKLSLDLFFDADTMEQAARNMIARKFLLASCYPRRPVGDLLIGGPPRLLFMWPGFISLTCGIMSLGFTYQRFAPSGIPVEFMASVVIEEIRDMRLIQDDVLANGTIRGPGSDPFSGIPG